METVEVFGQKYSVRSDEDRQHLEQVAELVDRHMREVAGSSKVVSLESNLLMIFSRSAGTEIAFTASTAGSRLVFRSLFSSTQDLRYFSKICFSPEIFSTSSS